MCFSKLFGGRAHFSALERAVVCGIVGGNFVAILGAGSKVGIGLGRGCVGDGVCVDKNAIGPAAVHPVPGHRDIVR